MPKQQEYVNEDSTDDSFTEEEFDQSEGNLPPVSSGGKSSKRAPSSALVVPQFRGALANSNKLSRKFWAEIKFNSANTTGTELYWTPDRADMLKLRRTKKRGDTRFGDLSNVLVTRIWIIKTQNQTLHNVAVSFGDLSPGCGYGNHGVRGNHAMMALDNENFESNPLEVYQPPLIDTKIVDGFADKISNTPDFTIINEKSEDGIMRQVYVFPENHAWSAVIRALKKRDFSGTDDIRDYDGNFYLSVAAYEASKKHYEVEVLANLPRQNLEPGLESGKFKLVFKRIDGEPWNDVSFLPMFVGKGQANQTSTNTVSGINMRLFVGFRLEYFVFGN